MKSTLDIVALRKSMNLTQAEFARRIGVNTMTICRWETKGLPNNGPARALLERMAEEAAQ